MAGWDEGLPRPVVIVRQASSKVDASVAGTKAGCQAGAKADLELPGKAPSMVTILHVPFFTTASSAVSPRQALHRGKSNVVVGETFIRPVEGKRRNLSFRQISFLELFFYLPQDE